jgi:hypothetical protein
VAMEPYRTVGFYCQSQDGGLGEFRFNFIVC